MHPVYWYPCVPVTFIWGKLPCPSVMLIRVAGPGWMTTRHKCNQSTITLCNVGKICFSQSIWVQTHLWVVFILFTIYYLLYTMLTLIFYPHSVFILKVKNLQTDLIRAFRNVSQYLLWKTALTVFHLSCLSNIYYFNFVLKKINVSFLGF